MVQFEILGLRCHQVVANSFQKINVIRNGDSMFRAEDYGKGEDWFSLKGCRPYVIKSRLTHLQSRKIGTYPEIWTTRDQNEYLHKKIPA